MGQESPKKCRGCGGPCDAARCPACRKLQRKAWSDAHRGAGMCPRCGRRPAPGRATCPGCLLGKKHAREDSIESRKCPKCGKRPAAEGRKRCGACLEGDARAAAARILLRMKSKLCARCGAPAARGKANCRRCSAEHLARVIAARDARKAAGLCVRCGRRKPHGGTLECLACRKRRKAQRAAARAKGGTPK